MTKKQLMCKVLGMNNITLSKEDSTLDESKRVLKLIKKYKTSTEEASSKGILSRGSKVNVLKSSLRNQQPDEWDKKNIDELIKTYNLAYPYPHKESLQTVIEENKKIISVSNRKTRRKGILKLRHRLPVPFVIALKVAYPLILTDKVQSKWFDENYPEFNLVGVKKDE